MDLRWRRCRDYRLIIVTDCKVSILASDHVWAQLTDIFISQLVRQPNALRLMLDRFAIYNSNLELLGNGLVNGVALGVGQ